MTHCRFEKVRFNGAEYLWIDGSLATKEQYISGEVSYAWVDTDGIVWRYRVKLGTQDQIEFTGEFEEFEMTMRQIDDALPSVIAGALLGMFGDPPEAEKFRSERN